MSILDLDIKEKLLEVGVLSNLLTYMILPPPNCDSEVISLFNYITLVVGGISSADGFRRAYTRREVNLLNQ